MKCPYCLVEVQPIEEIPNWFKYGLIGKNGSRILYTRAFRCPSSNCSKLWVVLSYEQGASWIVYPKSSGHPPVQPEVNDPGLVSDYTEACLVITDSPKASAALSRRCLQHLLRTKAGVKHSDLSKEIQQVLDSGKLPTHLAEGIDAVRNIGNFAAHPIKDHSTGEIVEVEPGEADWLLEILHLLFDFYFVQPTQMAQKRANLNTKLAAAKKPPVK